MRFPGNDGGERQWLVWDRTINQRLADYAAIPDPAKWVLAADMLLGRLNTDGCRAAVSLRSGKIKTVVDR